MSIESLVKRFRISLLTLGLAYAGANTSLRAGDGDDPLPIKPVPPCHEVVNHLKSQQQESAKQKKAAEAYGSTGDRMYPRPPDDYVSDGQNELIKNLPPHVHYLATRYEMNGADLKLLMEKVFKHNVNDFRITFAEGPGAILERIKRANLTYQDMRYLQSRKFTWWQ